MIPRREYRSETSWRCRQVTPRPAAPLRVGGSDLTDIHCHCLPGLDDGPAAPVEALALCRALVADGIRQVVATPHQLGRFEGHYDAGAIRAAAGELSGRLREARIPLAVLPGADVRLDERIPQLLRSDIILTAADGRRYLLLELPHEVFIDPGTLLPELASMGVTAIITHPERHTHLARHPEYVRRWAEDGVCLQITAGSFGGDFGRQSQKAAWAFLHAPMPILVATDAHDTSGRPPRLSEAYSLLAQEFGYIVADILCVENPCRVVEGRDLLMLTRSDLREEVVR